MYIYIYIYIYIYTQTHIRGPPGSCTSPASAASSGRASWPFHFTDHRGAAMSTSPERRLAALAASCHSHLASTP